MPMRWTASVVRLGSAAVLGLVLAACTQGGQFDPTEVFNSDAFDSKKKLQGNREPLFPNGVPGAATGVPPDLVKGYQPPPDQAADNNAAPDAAAPAPAKPEPKPKPKPKPQVARAPAPAPGQPQGSVFDQKPPTRISVGPAAKPGAAAPQGDTSQSAAPASAPIQQTAGPSQSVWPTPPQTRGASQSVGTASPPAAPAQQTAQPAQSIWPNPPAPGASSQ
jgi:hypothetical protein